MESLTTIEIPTPFGVGPVNCHVLDTDELTLIDPGPSYGEAYSALQEGLSRIGYSVSDVDNVVMTHAHIDHFGQAGRVRRESGATTMINEVSVQKVNDPDGYYYQELEYFTPFFESHGVPRDVADVSAKVSEPYLRFHEPTDIDVPLSDGDVLDIGIQLECLETPGHSMGGISYFWEETKTLFTGDHILNHITPNPTLQMPRDGERPKSLPEYIDSLRELKSVPAITGYTGHGAIIPDLQTRLAEIIDHHETRKEVFYRYVEEEPVSAYEIMKQYWENLPLTEYFLGLSEVIGHMDLLMEENRVKQVGDETIHYVAT